MGNKHKILIIDDDQALLMMTGEILRSEYEVSFATSGKQTIELLSGDYVPDIILLDIDMPEMNGFETLQAIRNINGLSNVPLIFLTGVTRTESEIEGLSLGASDYITKPFVKGVLLARIKLHLDNAQRLKSVYGGIDKDKFNAVTSALNDTEKKVAWLIAAGYSNKEIAENLNYSYAYVKKVVNAIFLKLEIHRRNEVKMLFL